MAQAQRANHLASVPLFSRCSQRDLRRLARVTRLDLIEAGQALIAEGEPSRQAYVIVAGRALVERGGRRKAQLGPGDVVGELGLLGGRPRMATVTAETPMEVLVLDRVALRECVDEVPGLGWKLLETVTERMADNACEPGVTHLEDLEVSRT